METLGAAKAATVVCGSAASLSHTKRSVLFDTSKSSKRRMRRPSPSWWIRAEPGTGGLDLQVGPSRPDGVGVPVPRAAGVDERPRSPGWGHGQDA